MSKYSEHDTIIAPATPAGEGSVGILRLSGPQAEERLLRHFRPGHPTARLQSHRLYHGYIRSPAGECLDEVMAVLMRKPRSYTREDVVEIHCHGGSQIMRRLLDLYLEDGLRLARPGEFTLRAFLNGRLDLAQAEAVIDLIRAASDSACRIALGQLEGRLSTVLRQQRHRLLDLLALVEAHVDFPEEDLPPPDNRRLATGAGEVLADLERLLESFDAGRTLREGMAVLILGKPNVGKSSLLNHLLGEARAIVTPIAGTTRDTIEERLVLGGIPIRLIDTAGIRETTDPIEEEGVRRARDKIAAADLILLVIDGSRPVDPADRLALELSRGGKVLLVLNKTDLGRQELPAEFAAFPRLHTSVHTGEGIEELKAMVIRLFLPGKGEEGTETILLSDRRHRQALLRTRDALGAFLEGLAQEQAPEFLAIELKEALRGLGEVTGETAPDEVLDRIFARFCIGK